MAKGEDNLGVYMDSQDNFLRVLGNMSDAVSPVVLP